jgi:hypothetical protein
MCMHGLLGKIIIVSRTRKVPFFNTLLTLSRSRYCNANIIAVLLASLHLSTHMHYVHGLLGKIIIVSRTGKVPFLILC